MMMFLSDSNKTTAISNKLLIIEAIVPYTLAISVAILMNTFIHIWI